MRHVARRIGAPDVRAAGRRHGQPSRRPTQGLHVERYLAVAAAVPGKGPAVLQEGSDHGTGTFGSICARGEDGVMTIPRKTPPIAERTRPLGAAIQRGRVLQTVLVVALLIVVLTRGRLGYQHYRKR